MGVKLPGWLTGRRKPAEDGLERRVASLERQLADARAEAEAAADDAATVREHLDRAFDNVSRLTARLKAVDGDRLRAENDDLRAEVARLRAARPGPSLEQYLRERETSARLAERLIETEERLDAAIRELETRDAAQVSV